MSRKGGNKKKQVRKPPMTNKRPKQKVSRRNDAAPDAVR